MRSPGEKVIATLDRRRDLGEHRIGERGHGCSASADQSSNGRSVSARQATCAPGSTHRRVPAPPKCPNVAGELRRARPVRLLVAADLGAEPPRAVGEAADARHDARRGRGTARCGTRRRRLGADAAWAPRSSATKRTHVVAACCAGRAPASRAARCAPCPAAASTASRWYCGERHPRRVGERGGGQLDAGVAVDAPLPGRGDRLRRRRTRTRRRGTSRWRSVQPGLPDRLVEVHDAFLARDEHRPADEHLGDRRQPERLRRRRRRRATPPSGSTAAAAARAAPATRR